MKRRGPLRCPCAAPAIRFDGIALGSMLIPAALMAISLASAALAADQNAHRDDLSERDRIRVRVVTAHATDFSRPEPYERMAGGAATSVATVNANSFSHPSANLTFEGQRDFALGNGLFRKVWVSSPSSTQASDGLGPLFDARACQRCHLKDGRGHPPRSADEAATSMVIRLSAPARTPEEHTVLESGLAPFLPDPVYGSQLQAFAVPGIPAEGNIAIAYEEIPVELNGDETASLRRPAYSVEDLGYGPMAMDVMLSPRVAPPMIGLGLLEAVHPGDIFAGADPHDADGDGISGRPSVVHDPSTGQRQLGRFGWKASTPNVREQTAKAFSADIGISTPDLPDSWGDCTASQRACRTKPSGVQRRLGDTEAPEPVAGARLVLRVEPCGARSARRGRSRGAPRQGTLSPDGMRFVPHAEVRDSARRRPARAPVPAHLALHRSAPPRHGRGPCRQPSRRWCVRAGVADPSALGNRSHANGERAHVLPPRRPGPQPPRSSALAWWRGARLPRRGRRDAAPGSCRARSLSRVALMGIAIRAGASLLAIAAAFVAAPRRWTGRAGLRPCRRSNHRTVHRSRLCGPLRGERAARGVHVGAL